MKPEGRTPTGDPSRERCLCGSICEAREAMDPPEPIFFPGDAYAEEANDA